MACRTTACSRPTIQAFTPFPTAPATALLRSISLPGTHSAIRSTFSGNAWFRNIRTEGINAESQHRLARQSVYQPSAAEQAALTAAGYTGFPDQRRQCRQHAVSEMALHRASALQLNDPDESCDGVIVYSKELQNDYGFSGQLTWITSPRIGRNQFAAGAISRSRQRRLHAEHAVRLSQSRLHDHGRSGMAGWIHHARQSRRFARQPAWRDSELEPLFHRHAHSCEDRECDGFGALQPVHDRQYRPDQSHRRPRLARPATMSFSDSTLPSGLPGAPSPP